MTIHIIAVGAFRARGDLFLSPMGTPAIVDFLGFSNIKKHTFFKMPRRVLAGGTRRRRKMAFRRAPRRRTSAANRAVLGKVRVSKNDSSRWFEKNTSSDCFSTLKMWNVNAFPPQYPVHMQYCSEPTVLQSGIAGVVGPSSSFNLNSLFAPATSGGHQPYFRDQLASIYGYYKITSCTVKITARYVLNPTFTLLAQVRPSNDRANTIVGKSSWTVIEEPGTAFVHGSTAGNTGCSLDMGTISIQNVEGVPKIMYDADTDGYNAAVGATPSKAPILEVAVASLDGNSGNTGFCYVQLVMHGFFYGRDVVAYS